MIRALSAILTVAALAGGLVLAGGPAAAAEPDFAALAMQPYTPPKPAPPFALPDLDGHTVRLEDFRGKVLLLFFWATW
jgi:cytochrome oxidase Cu insertion factor (SCO1/SenC/PrrC family)